MMPNSMHRKWIELLTEQNNKLEKISAAVETKNTTRGFKIERVLAVLALLISAFSVLFSIYSYADNSRSQQQTQAFGYWQTFLQLAAEKPLLANGDDSRYYETHRRDSIARVEYAWFVANALGAAEMVYQLQKGDPGWEATLKEVIGLHSHYIVEEKINESHYNNDFVDLINTAINERKARMHAQ